MYNLKHLKAYVQGKFLRLHIIVSVASSLLPDLLHHFLAPGSEGSFDHSPLFTWFLYYKHLVPLKMGWSENRPHLFWYNVVIKFLCTYFLATIEKGGCGFDPLSTIVHVFIGSKHIILPIGKLSARVELPRLWQNGGSTSTL